MKVKPGDTVDFTLTFRGKVSKVRAGYVHVWTSKSPHMVPMEDIVRVIHPEPDEDDVIRKVRCPGCNRYAGSSCIHKQSRRPIKHPHKERIETYILMTGWTPGDET